MGYQPYAGVPGGGHQFCVLRLPFIVINAVALLCFFARTEFRSKALRKGIAVLSPAALGGVYHPCASPGVELCAAGLPDLAAAYPCVADAPVGGGAGLWHLSGLLAD